MAKDEVIEIKVEVDTSDVKKSMQDVSKETDKMAKDIVKAGDKAEDSFDGLEKSIKDINKQMKNIGKNVNLNGFASAMNTVKKTALNAVSTVSKAFDSLFKNKKTIEVNAKTTTDASGGAGASTAAQLAGSALTGGAMGSQIAKQMANSSKDVLKLTDNIKRAFGEVPESIQEDMKETVSDVYDMVREILPIVDMLREEGFDIDLSNPKELKGIILGMKEHVETMLEELDEGMQNLARWKEKLSSRGDDASWIGEDIKTQQEEIDFLSQRIEKLQQGIAKVSKLDFVLNLDTNKSVMEIDRLLSKFDELPTRMSKADIEPIIRELAVLREEMQGLGIDTSAMEGVFTEWNAVCAKGSQATVKLTTEMLKAKKYVTSLKQGTQELVTVEITQNNKQEELENSTNLLVRALGKLKSGYKSLSSSIKTGYKSLQEARKQTKELGDEVEKTGSKLKSTSKNMTSSFKSMTKALAPYLGLAAIFGGLKKSITSYTDSLQDSSKFGLVFGSEAQNMTDWLNGLNSTVTTSKGTLMDFSSNLFRMGRNMEMSTQDAMDMSKRMTELGADLVAFTNDANSIEALAGALRGEYDSLQNYGYALDAASVEAEAMALGLDTASESALLFARQSLILKQSGDVLGYGATQAKTLGGQLAMLQKNFQALGTAIGSCFAGLLQVVLPVLNSIVSAVTSAFNKIASVINAIFGLFGIKVGTSGASTGGSIGGAIGDAVGGITDSLGSGLDDAGGGAGKVADELDKASGSAKELKKYLAGVDELNLTPEKSQPSGGSGSGSSGSGSGAGGAGGVGAGGIGDVANITKDSSNIIKESVEEVAQWIKDLANGLLAVWNMLKAGWQSVGDYISTSIANLKQAFANLGQSILDFLVGAWNNGGAELVFNFGRLAGAVTGAIIDISGQCVQMVADLFTHLNPETNPYTQAFIKGLNNLLIACQNFALSVGGWFKTFVDNGGQAFLNVMGDIVMILGTTLANTLATTINWITRFMNSWAGQTLIKGVAIALDIVAGALKLVLIVVEKLTPLWSALLLKFAVVSVFTKLTKALKLLKSALVLVSGKLASGLGITAVIVKFKALANAVKLAYLQLKGGVVLSQVIQKFGLLPGLIAGIVNAFKTWTLAVKGATIGQTAYNVALSIGAGAMQLLFSPVTLIIGAIAALVAIIDIICQKFFNWEGIISWLGEKLGWLWDKIKSFFGWEGDNNIDDEIDLTSDSLDGLGYTMEQTSERFGTSCSAMNEALASIHVDSNQLAISLDEAEKTFNEKFSRMSASGQEYLDALVTGNQEVLDEMAGDSEKYLEEIAYVWDGLSQQEKAIMYATYGEINGITDGWCDYTKGSYEDALLAHAAYIENINNNETLSAQEKDRLTDEATEKFKQSYQDRLDAVNATITEIENMEGISQAERNAALEQAYLERDNIINSHAEYQLGSIDTIDEAVKTSAKTQEDAYNNVGESQEQALEGVSTALEETKTDLSTFKEESDKVAKEIPEAWAGIGETISEEFDEASNEVVKSLHTMNNKVKTQSNTLKTTLKSAFATINDGTKKSMTTMTNNIKQAFDKMSKNIKTQMQQIATELQARFTQINNGLNKSFTTMSTQVITVLKNMATQISNSLKGVETTFKTSMNNISNIAKTKIQDACKTITSKVEAMKQPITNSFNGIKTNVGNSLDALNKTVTNKMQVVLNTVKRFVNQLQNATNFTFKTPYMKMPHINVHGDWNFEKKTTPSFSVRWYSDGGIFNQRSLIGVGDKYHGIGNNAEAVVPLDSMYKNIRNIVKEENKANTGDTRPVTITLNVDGKELARSTVSSMKDLARVNALDMSWL